MKAKWITLILAAILAATVTAVSLTACGSEDTASVAESAVVSETAAEIAETTVVSETAAEETATEPAAESATESTEAPAESAAQPATQPATPVQVSAGATAQQPQTTAPATQPQTHAPIYTQRWVVDKAAWTEEQPVYATDIRVICNTCNADITEQNVAYHVKDHTLKGEATGGHREEPRRVQTGTKIINHPEEGHFENVLICGGCTGTH